MSYKQCNLTFWDAKIMLFFFKTSIITSKWGYPLRHLDRIPPPYSKVALPNCWTIKAFLKDSHNLMSNKELNKRTLS